ncbi:MAG: cobalamin biosynthesis protein P47K [Armatimonadetes bacterium]|nr:cobalamin biosynthesis protein P47K [Armatimonadota bacterium]
MAESGARKPVTFLLVGGFLGAGKTTTLVEVAKRIAASGQRVGLITNDQADDLVDTGIAKLQGVPVSEIAGGCFCCKFDALVASSEEILNAIDPDVLLAEPVGSCTDISATVIQPLKKFYGEWCRVTPYSVLVDPERVTSTLTGPLAGTDIGYLFRKQLEEADVIVLNKIDKLDDEARGRLYGALKAAFPGTPVYGFSALTGEGVDTWWRELKEQGTPGGRILEVDYDTYADAEAALGWLNATVALTATEGFDGDALAAELLEDVRRQFVARDAEVGHVKLLLTTAAGTVRGNLVSTAGPADMLGSLGAPATEATLTFNARVTVAPEELSSLVCEAIGRVAGRYGAEADIQRLASFRPGRPRPTHRFAEVV